MLIFFFKYENRTIICLRKITLTVSVAVGLYPPGLYAASDYIPQNRDRHIIFVPHIASYYY